MLQENNIPYVLAFTAENQKRKRDITKRAVKLSLISITHFKYELQFKTRLNKELSVIYKN